MPTGRTAFKAIAVLVIHLGEAKFCTSMCAALKRRDFEVLCGNMSDVSRKYVKTIVPDAVIIRVDQRTTHLLRSALMNMSEKNRLSSDLPTERLGRVPRSRPVSSRERGGVQRQRPAAAITG